MHFGVCVSKVRSETSWRSAVLERALQSLRFFKTLKSMYMDDVTSLLVSSGVCQAHERRLCGNTESQAAGDSPRRGSRPREASASRIV
jgi:hypothetical protein